MKAWGIAIAVLIFSVLVLIALLSPGRDTGRDAGEADLAHAGAGPKPLGTELVKSIADSPVEDSDTNTTF